MIGKPKTLYFKTIKKETRNMVLSCQGAQEKAKKNWENQQKNQKIKCTADP